MNRCLLHLPIVVCLIAASGEMLAASTAKRGGQTLDSGATTVAPKGDNANPTSRELEVELQRLPWPQFRRVIEAIPKLRSSVDAYGPAGWQFVKANYSAYPWHKKIDKLAPGQQKQLGELIRRAKQGR